MCVECYLTVVCLLFLQEILKTHLLDECNWFDNKVFIISDVSLTLQVF